MLQGKADLLYEYTIALSANHCRGGLQEIVIIQAVWFGTGTVVEKFDLMPMMLKRASLIGSTLRSRSDDFKAKLVEGLRRDFANEIKHGDIKPVIDKVLFGTALCHVPLPDPCSTLSPEGMQPVLSRQYFVYGS